MAFISEDFEGMDVALHEARLAGARGDVPVGAVIVHKGEVIAAAGNAREVEQDPTAHAEILALREAARVLGTWRLDGATMFVTLEPCVMCAGALIIARIARVVFGAFDEKAGAIGSRYNVSTDPRLNHEFDVSAGVREEESSELLTAFFKQRRTNP